MKELKTFSTGKGTYDSFPDKTARAELPKKLTRPATARVGDYLRIKSIGADGSMEVEASPAPEGGNGGSDVAYPDWSHLKWHIIGDSLTARDNDFAPNRYYDFISKATGIQLSLDGIGGTGYGAGVSTNQHFAERVKSIPDDVDIVTIFGSANDIRYANGANSEIFATLSWLTLNRPGLRCIVVPPAPVKWFERRSEEWTAYYERLKLCAFVCGHRFVSDMYECPPFDPNNEQHMAVFFTTDPEGIHPNEAGHKAMAPIIYNALLQELELANGYPRGGAVGDGENPSQDGFSPIATVTQTADGATISITDKNGTTTATVTNGKDGEDGHTPTKGVDYFTPADVQEIAEQAAERVEVPEGGEKWETIIDYTVPEDCTAVILTTDVDGKEFKLKKASAVFVLHPIEGAEELGTNVQVAYSFLREDTNPYGSSIYRWGFANVPKAAGKVSVAAFLLVDTGNGVKIADYSQSGEIAYAANSNAGLKIATSSTEGINMDTLEYKLREITACSVGSFTKAIGAGTRIKMMGVRA